MMTKLIWTIATLFQAGILWIGAQSCLHVLQIGFERGGGHVIIGALFALVCMAITTIFCWLIHDLAIVKTRGLS